MAIRLFKISVLLAFLVGLAFFGLSNAQTPDNRPAFMRIKLKHSQDTLEALTMGDFDKIAYHAEQLKTLSQDASWEVYKSKEYERQSVEFRRRAELLAKAAESKNLEAATLGHFRLTLSCVDCHEYMRSIKK